MSVTLSQPQNIKTTDGNGFAIYKDSITNLFMVKDVNGKVELLSTGGGVQGIQGVQGTIGLTGSQGITGTTGTTGAQGIIGLQGTTGSQGITGLQGTTGSQGIGIVYAFKADMGRLGENGTGDQTDISQVNQRTVTPYTSTIANVGTIPTASNDNKITFTFPSESVPPSSIYIYAFNANLNLYVWTQIDTSSANQNSINQVTGTILIPIPSAGGNNFSDTNLVTSFNILSYSIELNSSKLGAANQSGFGGITYGHYFIFFTFPS